MIAFAKDFLRRAAITGAAALVVVLGGAALRQANQASDAAKCDELIASHAIDACWVVDQHGTPSGGDR